MSQRKRTEQSVAVRWYVSSVVFMLVCVVIVLLRGPGATGSLIIDALGRFTFIPGCQALARINITRVPSSGGDLDRRDVLECLAGSAVFGIGWLTLLFAPDPRPLPAPYGVALGWRILIWVAWVALFTGTTLLMRWISRGRVRR